MHFHLLPSHYHHEQFTHQTIPAHQNADWTAVELSISTKNSDSMLPQIYTLNRKQNQAPHPSSHISNLKFHLHSNWIQAIITEQLYLLWYIPTGWRKGGGTTQPICVYGFAGKEINDPLFLFGFNEVGIEGLPNICFPLPCLSSSSTHCLFLICDLHAWWLTKDTGWRENSPLSRREVWSGRCAQHKRVNPSSLTTLEELPWVDGGKVCGRMEWQDRLGWNHNMWPPHVLHTKRSHWLAVNWTLGPPIKATAQKETGEKNKGKTHTSSNSHTHSYTKLSMGLH